MKHIVKRLGHTEPFDERKLFASIYSACLAVTVPIGEAEIVADKVCRDVLEATKDKYELTSGDISRKASSFLKGYNKDANYIYLHSHRLGR